MANLKASKKGNIVNKRNHERNKNLTTALKTIIKKAYQSIDALNDNTQGVVFQACRQVDKSITKGILKKKTAARKKSRLMKAYNIASAAVSK